MNSELTLKLIERRIANNNEGIAAMDRDGISNHLQRELYDGWKQDNAIYEFALVGLSVQPRPIADARNFPAQTLLCFGLGEHGEFVDLAGNSNEIRRDAHSFIPLSSLPTPKDISHE